MTRVAREVGTEGKLGGQAVVPNVSGVWKDLTDNVNTMAANLTTQVRGIVKVVNENQKDQYQRQDQQKIHWHDITLKPGDNLLHGLSGELWDIQAELELQDATAFGLRVRGEDIRYDVKAQTITNLGRTAPLKPDANKHVWIRVLVDRASMEVFGNGGQISMTSNFLPRQKEKGLAIFTEGGNTRIVSLSVHALRSAWSPLPK